MPFFNRRSHVQADFIPEGESQKASPYGDQVSVPESPDESAVRTAERRSIALTEGDVKGPEAIDPSEKGAADVNEVDDDVVTVEGPEPKTDMPEPEDNESDEATADAGEGLPRNEEGIEMDFVPEDEDDAVEDDGKSDVEAAVDNAEEDADRVDEVVEDQVEEESKDEPSGE